MTTRVSHIGWNNLLSLCMTLLALALAAPVAESAPSTVAPQKSASKATQANASASNKFQDKSVENISENNKLENNTLTEKSSILVPEHLTEADAQRIYREATEACLHNRMDEGIEAYRKLTEAGFTGEALNFNLGTALLRQGKLGPAILHLERAAAFGTKAQDVEANLAVARQLRIDRIKDAPETAAGTVGGSVADQIARETSADFWAITFMSLWLVGWILVLARRACRRQNIPLALGITLILISLPAGGITASHLWSQGHGSEAIVMVPALPVREGPDKALPPAFEIHEGLKVTVTDQEKGFRQIRLENGLQGWVPMNGIVKIHSTIATY